MGSCIGVFAIGLYKHILIALQAKLLNNGQTTLVRIEWIGIKFAAAGQLLFCFQSIFVVIDVWRLIWNENVWHEEKKKKKKKDKKDKKEKKKKKKKDKKEKNKKKIKKKWKYVVFLLFNILYYHRNRSNAIGI